jgi:hypothetical protein
VTGSWKEDNKLGVCIKGGKFLNNWQLSVYLFPEMYRHQKWHLKAVMYKTTFLLSQAVHKTRFQPEGPTVHPENDYSCSQTHDRSHGYIVQKAGTACLCSLFTESLMLLTRIAFTMSWTAYIHVQADCQNTSRSVWLTGLPMPSEARTVCYGVQCRM